MLYIISWKVNFAIYYWLFTIDYFSLSHRDVAQTTVLIGVSLSWAKPNGSVSNKGFLKKQNQSRPLAGNPKHETRNPKRVESVRLKKQSQFQRPDRVQSGFPPSRHRKASCGEWQIWNSGTAEYYKPIWKNKANLFRIAYCVMRIAKGKRQKWA